MSNFNRAEYISSTYYSKLQRALFVGVPYEAFLACSIDCAKQALPYVNQKHKTTCENVLKLSENRLLGNESREKCQTVCVLFAAYMQECSEIRDNESGVGIPEAGNNAVLALYSIRACLDLAQYDNCIKDYQLRSTTKAIDAAYYAHNILELKNKIPEIVDSHIPVEYVFLCQVAAVVAGHANEFNTDECYQEAMEELWNLPRDIKEQLVQYAFVIYETSCLREEFSFLITDYIYTTIPSQKLLSMLDSARKKNDGLLKL